MSAYRKWTLTCNGCGGVFDHGVHFTASSCKAAARASGWKTGRNKFDKDYCRNCKENND